MVAAFDYCLHGRGGAAPSIDTAMHGLVDAAARRPPAPGLGHRAGHRRRRRGADHGVLRRPGGVGALAPARLPARPGHRGDPAAANPQAIGVHPGRARHHRLGRHQRRVRGATRWRSSGPRRRSSAARGRPEPFGPVVAGLRAAARGRAAGQGGRAGPGRCAGWRRTDRPPGRPLHRQRRRAGLPGPGQACAALAALGTSCPDHFLRTKVRPLVARPARRPPTVEEIRDRLRELHAAYREDYAAYYERHATPGLARRCAAPTRRSCWCPASACSPSARTSRPRGWPASSTSTRSTSCAAPRRSPRYAPIAGVGEVPDRVLGAGGGQARPDAEAQAAGHPGRPRHRRRVRHRPGDRAPAGGRGRLRRRRRPGRRDAADRVAAELGTAGRRRSASAPTSPTRRRWPTRSPRRCSRSAASTWS